jgi:transposase, IS30 family
MSYHHLNRFDRVRIETLYTLGFSTRQIAIQTGWHHSSIARELVRNTTGNTYLAEDAHQSYENRRTDSKPHGKYDKTIADVIEEKLRLTWSPEQIVQTATLGKVSFKTIYNWMYQGKLSLDEKALRQIGVKSFPASN